jgi:hypothetical protein
MALVPGFDFDLFVSYAHADDVGAPDNSMGWVSLFVRQLEGALRQRLGRGADVFKIFFDSKAIGANYHLPELLATVRRSALFLAVGSPSYAARQWTQDELAAFVQGMSDHSRLFKIEVLPLNPGDNYPSPLDEHIAINFWNAVGPKQYPRTISPTLDAAEFSALITQLAYEINEKLLKVLHSSGGKPRPAFGTPVQSAAFATQKPRGPSDGAKKTVLLAQATDDVEEEADQLRRYLSQYEDEITVLPSAGYSQGGEAFAAAVQQDVKQSQLFVQLLGRRAGRIPPDLPQGYTLFQLNAAKAAGIEIMQWRHPDLDPSGISDPVYQKVVTAETVVASGLEAFKSQVLTWARKQREKPRKSPLIAQSASVFINADRMDMDIAKEIQRECVAQTLSAYLPMIGESSEANRTDLEENLTDCDVLLFIYGDTSQDWIRRQLRFFDKLKFKREASPKLLAICSGPPAQKPDIGMSFPNAHFINCPDGWDMSAIRNLLEGLSQ